MSVNVAMLAPAAALVAWSLVVLVWMTVTRFAGMGKIGVDLKQAKPGGRGQDLEAVLPPQTVWKAHNYTHLMEQPTIFYPTVLILAL
ncbi:MAG: MAPEG family protein, partial [Pseudomonadota bacterium]